MLHVGLKEWAVICDLLLEGKQIFVLRKGGIHERGGAGVFALEHDRFVLFPAWMHQKPEGLKQPYHDRVRHFGSEPDEVTFTGVGEAAKIWQVPSRQAFDQLDDLHCWDTSQIDMRFNYKPDRPLYLVAIRAYRLADPKTVEQHWSYKGCKSWVPLQEGHAVDDREAAAVLDDAGFADVVERIDRALSR